jgi:diaminopimelate epimerase
LTAQDVLRRMPVAYPLQRMAVCSPSGNTTAVIFGQVRSADRRVLNEAIMRSWAANPDQAEIEQCCFLIRPAGNGAIARVEMFGGEFCGNAARSAAWLVTGGRDCSGLIDVSGAGRLLGFRVARGQVTAEMPLPDEDPPSMVEEGILVRLNGIAHVVVTDPGRREAMTSRQLLESLIATDKYGLAGQPAAGVSYYDSGTSRAAFSVWVNRVGTFFDETACGSGSCAIGVAAAAAARGAIRLPVRQPSGEIIETFAGYDPARRRPVSPAITGGVKVLYDGGFVAVAAE